MKKLLIILFILGATGVLIAQTSVEVTVEPGADVTIETGATMSVNNGNFTVLVEENARGSFLEIGDLTFSGAGEARMQQYLTKDQWHAVSTPMSNENIAVYEWMYLYEWDEPTFQFSYLNLPLSIPLNPGEGYYLWNTLDTNTIFPNTPYFTVTHNGTFNKSDIVTSPTLTLGGIGSQNRGWNLMGNPFPCAIDWNGHADWNLENVLPTVYLGDYTNSGNYPTWNYSTNTGTLKSNIPASQRLHSDTTAFYKSGNEISEVLRLQVNGNNYYDETLIKFIPDATFGFDYYYDAHKMIGRVEAPQLYSIVGDEMLCMNFLPEVSVDLFVPLGFEVGAEGLYTINASQIEGFDEELFIYLDDLKENTVHDLKIDTEYTFTATPIDAAERFLIHFKHTAFAIDENELEQCIKISTKGNQLFVEVAEGYEGDLQMHNTIGQKLGNYHLASGKHEIPVSVNGVVLVTWVSDKGLISKKLFFK